jgi:peroxiredoxin
LKLLEDIFSIITTVFKKQEIMALNTQLSEVYQGFLKNFPAEALSVIGTANADFAATFQPDQAIKVGDILPSFTLSDALGNDVNSNTLLAKGPLLITFYRGSWCPFCNLALASLQRILPAITTAGVTLVAITPELPDSALSTAEKLELKFPVLSDVGNLFAEKLRIVFKQPDSLMKLHDSFGQDLKKLNGDDSGKVPIPATMLVDEKGLLRNLFLEVDYTKRLEPEEALNWIEELKAENS